MIDIPKIGIRSVEIPRYNFNNPSISIPPAPPVTLNLGLPVVDLPGCVEAYESNNKSLPEDDKRGVLTLCDSGIPSFNPIRFEPREVIPTEPAKLQPVKPPSPENIVQDIPPVKPPVIPTQVSCPTPAQEAREPIGTFIEGFRKKVIQYQLIGQECIQITEDVPLPKQIIAGLPSGGQVMTTSGIAVVATSSAIMAKPLADLLLKVIKPVVKKILVKINKLRGKESEILSVKERRDQQRSYSHAVRTLKGKG